jgi:hypothetical protein
MSASDYESEEARKAFAAGMEQAAKEFQGEPLTLADIRGMTAKEIMARKREVDEVLRRPREVNDGGE